MTRLALLAALALAAGLLGGCANETWIADRATAYNRALERTGNQALLLNILRASRRRPEYFSYISQVHGGQGLTLPSASVSLPFGAGAGGAANTFSASLGYVGTGGFDVGALDTDDFMRGITSPVDLRTIAHYWGQGWSPELLWFLLVRKVELERVDPRSADRRHDLWVSQWPKGARVSRANPDVVSFENYPGDDQALGAFKWISRRLLDEEFGLNPEEVLHREDIGPPLDAKTADGLRAMVADAGKGLALKRLPDGRYQAQRTSRYFAFSYPGACPGDVRATGYAKAPEYDDESRLFAHGPGCAKPPQRIVVHIRSPEGIQYYLGEIVRVGLRKAARGEPGIPTVNVCSKPGGPPRESLLFDVRRLAAGERSTVEVAFEGERYGVPPEPPDADEATLCDAQSTLHVLSFVSQLLSLQRSAKDLPTTGVVRVLP